ncbi:MAG: ABC transporter permease [Flectobacillus sp.]|uniref:ABC transporter permease n=1 Tax=Flectobacillus sp. TaxID=50419 RepID=UPI003B9ABF28
MKLDTNQTSDWEWEIKPSVGWFDFSLKKIFNHADLIWSLTKRDLQSSHKQTVLGNFWLIFQPLITTIVYTLVFSNIIKVSTDGMPPLLFYLTGNMLWSFFADSMFGALYTFRTNAHILSKVYFPRIILPISSVLVQAYKLGINFIFFLLTVLFYQLFTNWEISFNYNLLAIPFLLVFMALYALALGSFSFILTTKYKDLENIIQLAMRLYMFVTPVFYPVSLVSEELSWAFWFNPLTAIFESFRACYASNAFWTQELYISLLSISVFSVIALLVFRKFESKFIEVL